jgi:hypothetical protein
MARGVPPCATSKETVVAGASLMKTGKGILCEATLGTTMAMAAGPTLVQVAAVVTPKAMGNTSVPMRVKQRATAVGPTDDASQGVTIALATVMSGASARMSGKKMAMVWGWKIAVVRPTSVVWSLGVTAVCQTGVVWSLGMTALCRTGVVQVMVIAAKPMRILLVVVPVLMVKTMRRSAALLTVGEARAVLISVHSSVECKTTMTPMHLMTSSHPLMLTRTTTA